MTNNVHEISSHWLKDYVSSSKSCKINRSGCKLEPKLGRVLFDLSEFSNVIDCDIHLRKVSGAGNITVKYGESKTDLVITSKISQIFNIKLEGSHNVEVCRPSDSVGEVLVIGLSLRMTESKEDIAVSSSSPNWKDLIRRCGKYSCLKLANGRLFASNGAYIDDNLRITHIETNPPGMHARDNSRVKFLGSCEIVNLVVDSETPKAKSKKLYQHREAPTPVVASRPAGKRDATKEIIGLNSPHIVKYQSDLSDYDTFKQSVMFDSASLKAFQKFKHGANRSIKVINSNGKEYLLLRRNSKCSISISELAGNTDYICVLTAKTLNGNGKMFVGMSIHDGAQDMLYPITISKSNSNTYVTLKTGPSKYGQFHKLNLMMAENCTGEVLIEKILVVQNIGINRVKSMVEGVHVSSSSDKYATLSFGHVLDSDYDISDPVYKKSKIYSRHCRLNIDTSKELINIKHDVAINTVSGMSWFSKINGILPGVKLINPGNKVPDKTLLVSKMESLEKADYVWLDVFGDNEVNNKDIEKLKGAKKIFSPSLPNVQYLETACPNASVSLCCRPLPYMAPKSIPLFSKTDFVLAFHRSHRSTGRLLDSWSSELPRLVIVGARGKFPEFVLPVNEYLSYDKLLYLIDRAQAVIDMPANCDYLSSMLNITIAIGTPIVSTNWYTLDKKGCIFLPHNEKKDGVRLPTIKALKEAINYSIKKEKKKTDMSGYNKEFKKKMKELFTL